MNADYWLKRWREGRTGWHREAVLPWLTRHWADLRLPPSARVLVPFCGKSLDMIWLAAQGHDVLGVELSPLAIEQFFAENQLEARRQNQPDGVHYRAGNIEIIQGDLFATDAATIAGCDGVYDRAALIALAREQRPRYVNAIYSLLPTGSRGLVITLEYPQAEMDGPPFSVAPAEMKRLFSKQWHTTHTGRHDILADNPRFQALGLTALHAGVYRVGRF